MVVNPRSGIGLERIYPPLVMSACLDGRVAGSSQRIKLSITCQWITCYLVGVGKDAEFDAGVSLSFNTTPPCEQVTAQVSLHSNA